MPHTLDTRFKPGDDDRRRYWAFISYSHRDTRWAKKIHKALENYRIPTKIVGKPSLFGWPCPRRIFPVFLDEEELPTSANLGSNLTESLDLSHTLIVLCSPSSAASHWVAEEIAHYKRNGGEERVMAVILDGVPHASDYPDWGTPECFPLPLRRRINADGTVSELVEHPLAADLRPQKGMPWRIVKLKLIAGIIGVPFDDLRQRDLQRRRIKLATWSASVLCILGAFAAVRHNDSARNRLNQAMRHCAEAEQHLANRHLLHAGWKLLEAHREGRTPEQMRVPLTTVGRALIRQKDAIPSATFRLESVAFSPNSTSLAVAGEDGRVSIWNLTPEGALLNARRFLAKRTASQVAFHPDGSHVAVSMGDGTVRIWNFRENDVPEVCTSHFAKIRVGTVDFSHDGVWMASGGDDTFAKLWRQGSASWKLENGRLTEHEDLVKSVRFSPDDHLLATAGFDGIIRLFAPPDFLPSSEIVLRDKINRVAIDHGNKRVVAAGLAGSVWIYSLTEGRLVMEIPRAHSNRINDLVMHPDKVSFLTCGDDGYVRRWRLDDGELLASIETHSPLEADPSGNRVKILSVAISGDGNLAATAGTDGVVKLWELSPPAPSGPTEVLRELERLEERGALIGSGR